MLKSKFLIRGFLWLTAVSAVMNAQSVLVLPGANGSGNTIAVVASNPFQSQTTITNASPGAFLVLPKPDGTKYYVVSNAGGTGVSVYDQNFANGRVIGGPIPLAPTAAAISPDGRRLVVLANGAYIFDTSTDTLVNSNPIQISGNPIDVTFSLDSSKAFVLSNNGTAGVITPIDMTTNTAGTALTLAGNGAGITTGPNGFLYVTTPNRLFEIDPRTTKVTTSGEIPVNGSLGKPVLTPDGKYAIAVNRTPITGSSLVLFDLSNHTLAGTFPNFNVVLDKVAVAGPNRIFAYSSQNNTLYEGTIQGGLNLNPSPIASVIPSNIGAFALSNDIPARTAYITATANGQTNLYKVDLGSNTVAGQVSVPTGAGQVVAFPAANPTSGATTITPFNATQTVNAGAASLPLIARVQDSQGRPVFGARVDFTTATAGAVITPASAVTSSEGFAQTVLTAPSTPGVLQVSAATAGAQAATFNITVPGASTGGGGGSTNLAGIKIVSGNGQALPEQFPTTQPLTVLVTDANGNPAANVPVKFEITQGTGTLLGGTSGTVNTDNNGIAAAPFLASSTGGASFVQTTINASTSAGSVNFTLTTTLNTLPNGGPAAPPVVILLAPDFATNPQRLIKGGAGQIIPGGVKAQVVASSGPQAGQPIPNIGITLGPIAGDDPTKVPSATCANQALSDASGIASCDVLLGNVQGIGQVNVNVGGLVNAPPILVQITTGAPSKLTKVSGDAQSGRQNQTLPQALRIHLTDASGNSLPNIPLTWTVTQGSATLSATSATTDASGNGSATVTLGSTLGAVSIKVTAGSGTSAPTATFTATVANSIGGVALVSGNNQSAVTGASFAQQLVVLVTDTNGQPLAGVPVSFTVSSGSASVSQASVTTDSAGHAAVTATAGANAGPIVISAAAGSSSASFALTSRLPGPAVTASSFANAASGAAGLTPCGIAIASAPGLVPGTQGTVLANNFVGPLPTTLGGVSLTVNGVAAPIFWVTSGAVAFQTPCETQPGTASVVFTVNGSSTSVSGVPVAALQPGIFEYVQNGRRYAVLLHDNGSPVTPDNPARRGEALKMFATGLGSITTATATGRAGVGGQTVDAPVTVGVNNAGVRVISTEYLPGEVGIYVVTFEVPADTQPGAYQNLALVLAGPDGNAIFGNGSFLPIQ
jgi:uncharacterized protein (TIGR03437 family)